MNEVRAPKAKRDNCKFCYATYATEPPNCKYMYVCFCFVVLRRPIWSYSVCYLDFHRKMK